MNANELRQARANDIRPTVPDADLRGADLGAHRNESHRKVGGEVNETPVSPGLLVLLAAMDSARYPDRAARELKTLTDNMTLANVRTLRVEVEKLREKLSAILGAID